MDIIKKLPADLVLHEIMPYTYKHQPDSLMKDVQNYSFIKRQLETMYIEYWRQYGDSPNDWLSNDISRFCNMDIATMVGYQFSYIEKWRRLFYFRDKSDIIVTSFMENLTKRTSKRDVQLHLCILTPYEREELFEFCKNLYF